MQIKTLRSMFPIPHKAQSTTEFTMSLIFICSSISIITSFIIILFYCILFLQHKLKRSSYNSFQQSVLSKSTTSSLNHSFKSQSKTSRNFGLGSHAMFFLNFTSCLWAVLCLCESIYHPQGFIYQLDKYTTLCPLFGFLHNYFDLCIIGWSTTIIRLFLSSIKTTVLTPKEERKELIFGLIFGFCVPLSGTLLPFYSSSYGPTKFYCGFDSLVTKGKEVNMIWSIVMMLFTLCCIIYTFVATTKIVLFYKSKMVIVQKHNPKEFGVLKWYVFIFVCFPISLFITRAIKLVHLIYVWLDKDDNVAKWVDYVYACSFGLNGFINAMLCVFFFRKVCACGRNKNEENNISKISNDIKGMTELTSNLMFENKNNTGYGINEIDEDD